MEAQTLEEESTHLAKLKDKLREMFQLDRGDLDFGIYRIMNQKRDEVERFLDVDLLPQVRQAFEQYQSADKIEAQKELDKAIQAAQSLGVDPETTEKVKELRATLADSVDVSALEQEVYSALYNFFRRYYHEGDFISLRRYKADTYAIPYEGEEVKLYWANHDQYYIKTSENLKTYAFKLPSGKRVRFELAVAGTEQDNIKASNGKERRFILHTDEPLSEDDGEMVIHFEYHPDDEGRKQDALIAQAVETVLALDGFDHWLAELRTEAPTEKNPNRTLLEKHLTDYTAKNTFDYFIHKDLGGFLRRELDFFIKNEVMHLDDIENESIPRVEQYLSKLKALRKIAHKIIAFLEQLENFQKKLWLKKKFVLETHYCITLDRVPKELYPEIAANDAQREEWVRLFAIDEVDGYSEPLTADFLTINKNLTLDTGFFPANFKTQLISSFDSLDDKCDGILFNAENLQSLNFVQDRFRRQVTSVYIDPPYNTDAGPIAYKNGYRHSSWLSLIGDRISCSTPILRNDSVICITIDDTELHYFRSITDAILPACDLLGVVAIKNNPAGRTGTVGFSICHEYALFYGISKTAKIGRLEHSEAQKARYKERDEIGAFEWTNFRKHGGLNTYRTERPRQYYPIYVEGELIRIPSLEWDNSSRTWNVLEEPKESEEVLLPIDDKGRERIWDFGSDTAELNLPHLMVRKDSKGKTAIYRKWRINDEGLLPQTWWDKSEYSAVEYGTNLLTNMFGETHKFTFPKSVHAVSDCLRVAGLKNDRNGLVLDYFAGSGTTGHAVLALNRVDGGTRKYVLVDMGDYFDTVLRPRLQKVTYAPEWKGGKPTSRDSGISQMFKYMQLESYEDALDNLEVKRTAKQQDLLDADQSQGADGLREEYLLSYMLDVETRESPSLLNIEQFKDPWNYELKITRNDETKRVKVDLVETFNWLLGLRVKTMSRVRGVYVVTGLNPQDEKVLILWRKLEETDNGALDKWFGRQQYNTREQEYDLIYVNGDNHLENLRKDEDTWKVRLIEQEFKRLMFDVRDV